MKTTIEVYRFLTESMTNKDLDKQSMHREEIMGLIDGSYSKFAQRLGFNFIGIGAHSAKAFAKADIVKPHHCYPQGINTFAQKIMFNIADCLLKSGLMTKRKAIDTVRDKVNCFTKKHEFKNFFTYGFTELLSYGRRISGNKHKYAIEHGACRAPHMILATRLINKKCKESNSGRHVIFTDMLDVGNQNNLFRLIVEISRSEAEMAGTDIMAKNISEQISAVLNVLGLSFSRNISKNIIEYHIHFDFEVKEPIKPEAQASDIVKEGVHKLILEVNELNSQIKALEEQVSTKKAKIERMGIALETLKELGV